MSNDGSQRLAQETILDTAALVARAAAIQRQSQQGLESAPVLSVIGLCRASRSSLGTANVIWSSQQLWELRRPAWGSPDFLRRRLRASRVILNSCDPRRATDVRLTLADLGKELERWRLSSDELATEFVRAHDRKRALAEWLGQRRAIGEAIKTDCLSYQEQIWKQVQVAVDEALDQGRIEDAQTALERLASPWRLSYALASTIVVNYGASEPFPSYTAEPLKTEVLTQYLARLLPAVVHWTESPVGSAIANRAFG